MEALVFPLAPSALREGSEATCGEARAEGSSGREREDFGAKSNVRKDTLRGES
jgi:hypothetical protein